MVVDELAGLRVLAVALGLGAERADHLRVAVHASLGDVEVAAHEFERRVRRDRGDPRDVALDREHGHDLEEARDADRDRGPDREGERQGLPVAVPAHPREDVELAGDRQRRAGGDRRGLERRGRPSRRERRGLVHRHVVGLRRVPPGEEEVHAADDRPEEVEASAEHPDPVERQQDGDRLDEVGVLEVALRIEGPPHESLRESRGVDRNDVEQDPDRAGPEVQVRPARLRERRLEEPRREPVQHAEGHEADPAQRARVHVGDRPVGVVAERVDGLHAEERALEGAHPVEGDAHHEELEDRIGRDAVPRAAQREEPVDHAAPGGHPEHHREEHAERRGPLRQRGVVQVVRPRPDVDEHQAPEVHDREPVAEHRLLRGLREEVVHEPQERRGEEERHRVVAVPPLHEGVLRAGVDRVAAEPARGHREVVEDVEDRDRDDRRDVEPQRDVEMPLAALDERPEEVHREDDPHQDDRDVEEPLELGVLLRLRDAEGQGQRRADDDQLPAPEVDPRQQVAEHPGLEEPLRGVVDRREDRVAGEGEDHRIGVQRPQPPEGEPLADVEPRVGELQRDDHADKHADDPPDHRGGEELPDDVVVVAEAVERPGRSRPVGDVGGEDGSAHGSFDPKGRREVRRTKGSGDPGDEDDDSVSPGDISTLISVFEAGRSVVGNEIFENDPKIKIAICGRCRVVYRC